MSTDNKAPDGWLTSLGIVGVLDAAGKKIGDAITMLQLGTGLSGRVITTQHIGPDGGIVKAILIEGNRWVVKDPVVTDYTASFGELVQINMTGNPVGRVITLPVAAPSNNGQRVCLVDITTSHTGTWSVQTQGGQTILPNGGTSIAYVAPAGRLVLVSNGGSFVRES